MANRKINGIIPPHQTCVKCNEVKGSEYFSKKEYKGKAFLNKLCKKCVCDRVKKYKEKNRDKVLESKRRYWYENRDRLLESQNEKSRQYCKNNPEKRRATAREWARRNREKVKDYRNNRYRTDPEFNIHIKIRRRIYIWPFLEREVLKKIKQ